jgi:hypothetical protein
MADDKATPEGHTVLLTLSNVGVITYSRPTLQLRWLQRRGEEPRLQQFWETIDYDSGNAIEGEWLDVETTHE